MSIFNDMFSDWPFVLFVAAFVFACASLVFSNFILLAVGLVCAVVANILEKKGQKNAENSKK